MGAVVYTGDLIGTLLKEMFVVQRTHVTLEDSELTWAIRGP